MDLVLLIALLAFFISLVFFLWLKERQRIKTIFLKIHENEKKVDELTQLLVKRQKLQNKELEEEKIKNLEKLTITKISTDEDWKEFKEKFIKMFPGFLFKIRMNGYTLTESEEQLVALEKLGLKTKQIANLLGISFNSVLTNRYRLRKKVGATKGETITFFFENHKNHN